VNERRPAMRDRVTDNSVVIGSCVHRKTREYVPGTGAKPQ
jgi:hypothetical protein